MDESPLTYLKNLPKYIPYYRPYIPVGYLSANLDIFVCQRLVRFGDVLTKKNWPVFLLVSSSLLFFSSEERSKKRAAVVSFAWLRDRFVLKTELFLRSSPISPGISRIFVWGSSAIL